MALDHDQFLPELKDISQLRAAGVISATEYETRWNAIEAKRTASLGLRRFEKNSLPGKTKSAS